MSRELLILRHGKSDWSVLVDDFRRPLVERGKRGALQIGCWLLQNQLVPDRIVSSPAERAITTAGYTAKAMDLKASSIIVEERVYAAGFGALLEVIRDTPSETNRLLLVGHNPGLEELLGYLVDVDPELPEDGKLLPTATLARLIIECPWDQVGAGCARLDSITRPRSLEQQFPFSKPGGSDFRDRPDYYYSQSSVIPYRIVKRKPEFLLVSSRGKKRLIVPKGINEPAMTVRQSAAKEALEEAGAEGVVAEQPIGQYSYYKWGGVCTVDVYPMEVTRLLPEEEWEESYRGRNWLSAKRAAKALRPPELAGMVRKLAASLGGKG